MTRVVLLSMASALVLCACAGGERAAAAELPNSEAVFSPAARLEEPPPAPLPLWAATPVSGEQRLPPPGIGRRRAAGPPVARVEAANRAATREPRADAYLNAVQVYAWMEGALYRLYTSPERVSDIALQAGEALVSVAAGDTSRWVIGDTTSGAGAARRTHILVKPSAVGLRTNLVIATDRRVYHVQLESTARTAMASISWTYPEGELLALRRGEGAEPQPSVAAGVAVEALNFGYRIEGDDPPWRPVRAFDDGSQVFIEFPPGISQGEAPPLFVRGEGGRTELVNYRVRGRYYVVDRLFGEAELRLGERRQQVVRIVRGVVRSEKRRRGRTS
jgi:type IV secretion system protein VirB9